MICSFHQLTSNCFSPALLLVIVFYPYTSRIANGWHPSGDTRTRLWVIGVTFSVVFNKGKES